MSIMAARSDRTLRTTCEVLAWQTRALTAPSLGAPAPVLARLIVVLDDVQAAIDHLIAGGAVDHPHQRHFMGKRGLSGW